MTALYPRGMKLSWDNGSLGLDYPGCMSIVDRVAIYFFIQVVYFHISVLEYVCILTYYVCVYIHTNACIYECVFMYVQYDVL